MQLLPLFKIKKRLKKLAGRGCLLGRGWLRCFYDVSVLFSCCSFSVLSLLFGCYAAVIRTAGRMVLGIQLAVVPVVVWAADRVAAAWCCLASGRASGAGAGGCSARWFSSRGLRAGCLLPGGSWPGGGWLLPCLGGQWLARGGAFGWVWFSFLAFFCGFSRSKKMRLIAIKAIKDIRRDNLL